MRSVRSFRRSISTRLSSSVRARFCPSLPSVRRAARALPIRLAPAFPCASPRACLPPPRRRRAGEPDEDAGCTTRHAATRHCNAGERASEQGFHASPRLAARTGWFRLNSGTVRLSQTTSVASAISSPSRPLPHPRFSCFLSNHGRALWPRIEDQRRRWRGWHGRLQSCPCACVDIAAANDAVAVVVDVFTVPLRSRNHHPVAIMAPIPATLTNAIPRAAAVAEHGHTPRKGRR